MNLGEDEDLDIPVFLRKKADSTEVAEPANNYSSPSKIKEFLDKTDIINDVIKTAVGLV